MPSAANRQGISRCPESGHRVLKILSVKFENCDTEYDSVPSLFLCTACPDFAL